MTAIPVTDYVNGQPVTLDELRDLIADRLIERLAQEGETTNGNHHDDRAA